MFPPSQGSTASSSALPPLPDLSSQGSQDQSSGSDSMASILSGLAPVKNGVTSILQGCKQIQQTGMIPGSEQILSQIIALATSLLPMAAQVALQPSAQGPSGQVPQGIAPAGAAPQQ